MNIEETRKQTLKRGLRVPTETRNQDGSKYSSSEHQQPAWSKYKHFDLLRKIGHKSMRMYVAPVYFPIQKLTREEAELLRREILLKLNNDDGSFGYPKFDGGTFIGGMLRYECYNKHALAWIRNLGRDTCYKVFTGGALMRPYQFTVTFPERACCTTRSILRRITRENGIPTEDWLQLTRFSAGKKSTLKLKLNEQCYETLKKMGFILQYKRQPIQMQPIELNLDDPGAELQLRMERLHSLKQQKKLNRKAQQRLKQEKALKSSYTDGSDPSREPVNQNIGGNRPLNGSSFDDNQLFNSWFSGVFGNHLPESLFPPFNSPSHFGNGSPGGLFLDNNQPFNGPGHFGNGPDGQFFGDHNSGEYPYQISGDLHNNQLFNGYGHIGNRPPEGLFLDNDQPINGPGHFGNGSDGHFFDEYPYQLNQIPGDLYKNFNDGDNDYNR